MSLTFLILILFILAIVVFFLAFREPIARFAAGTAANHGNTAAANTADSTPSPEPSPAASGKKTSIVVDGGQASPIPSLQPNPSPNNNTPAPSSQPSPRPSSKPKVSPSVSSTPSLKPAKTPNGQEDLKAVSLYYTRVDDNGKISLAKVNRSIKFINDSPLVSSIQALLKGPTSAELSNGLISMIPKGTTLLSAWVTNSIAYLNFSENFQFNSLGADGLRAQVKQVIWVATEFPTVKAVQILIEGKTQEYLGGDNVEIGKPLTR